MTQHRKFANPGPLGLSAFALTTFVLSLHNGAIGQPFGTPPVAVMGLAFFYGGLCQLLAGMWEFAHNNTLGATAFSSYGGFWMSYAVLITPGFNVLPALEAAGGTAKAHGIGIFLLGWVIMTFIFFVASMRTSLGLCSIFALLEVTFILLCAGDWTGTQSVTKAGGYFGLFTALLAWYVAASQLITTETSVLNLPNPSLSRRAVAAGHEDESKMPDGN
ncbi:hypothetical protein IWQ57_002340 [Coemansia nantahalensis]|uniref:Uncharacterized protein n=2 Tax=Coemansia TaxID=4863 RepID=A0ACC1LGY6_9FUNG|nr:hypothetical protein IWQ57_002340 [Coemansia nantahalensis]KAJ2807787.1 hypothetical protein H4R21_000342 [Coemansia helicoidea]